MTPDQLVDSLKEEMGLEEEVKSLERGSFEIAFEEGPVRIKKTEEGLFFFAEAGEAPERGDRFYEEAMRANLFGQGTLGAHLGLSYDRSKVTLARRAGRDLDYAAFKELLEDFLNVLSYWQEQLPGKNP